MDRTTVLAVLLVGMVLVVGASLAAGVVPLPLNRDPARPPCEQLPDRQRAADAVASHQHLVTQIRNVGAGMRVEVATPCEEQPERAIVRITYETDDERDGVDAILTQADGFGVPVELVAA